MSPGTVLNFLQNCTLRLKYCMTYMYTIIRDNMANGFKLSKMVSISFNCFDKCVDLRIVSNT